MQNIILFGFIFIVMAYITTGISFPKIETKEQPKEQRKEFNEKIETESFDPYSLDFRDFGEISDASSGQMTFEQVNGFFSVKTPLDRSHKLPNNQYKVPPVKKSYIIDNVNYSPC